MPDTPDAAGKRLVRGWSTDVVRTTDKDEAQERISAVFSPHTLEIVGPDADLDVVLRARRTDSITVADIRHGTEVVVRPGRLESYYEINIPLRGFTVSQSGSDEIQSAPDRAAILAPTEESSMRWSADCAQIAVKVSRAVVDRTLETTLGYPPDEAVHFAIGFDIASEPGRNWVRAVALLRDAIDTGAPDLVLRPLEPRGMEFENLCARGDPGAVKEVLDVVERVGAATERGGDGVTFGIVAWIASDAA